jgi:hypothetical protein
MEFGPSPSLVAGSARARHYLGLLERCDLFNARDFVLLRLSGSSLFFPGA